MGEKTAGELLALFELVEVNPVKKIKILFSEKILFNISIGNSTS